MPDDEIGRILDALCDTSYCNGVGSSMMTPDIKMTQEDARLALRKYILGKRSWCLQGNCHECPFGFNAENTCHNMLRNQALETLANDFYKKEGKG